MEGNGWGKGAGRGGDAGAGAGAGFAISDAGATGLGTDFDNLDAKGEVCPSLFIDGKGKNDFWLEPDACFLTVKTLTNAAKSNLNQS